MNHAPSPPAVHGPLTDIHIDPAHGDDMVTISGLATTIWRRHYPGIISRKQIDYMLKSRYAPDHLQAESVKSGANYLMLRQGDSAIGFAALAKADDAPDELILRSFYLDPALHGRGIGRHFMNHIVTLARNRGYQEITLTVNRRNIKAINFYFKAGYQIRSAVDIAIGQGFTMNDFIMARRLP
jgi:GNAT superfamily N-acetyltransferase